MSFTIKDVSDKLNLSSHTIRYYEKEGVIPEVKRTENGVREYATTDIQWLELVCCLKETGMPLKDIKEIVRLSLATNTEDTLKERLEILTNHKNKVLQNIESTKKNLEKINKKIDYYKGYVDCK
ncbi:MerR family transcriptional regulator [Vallitalea sediminicola]